MHNDDDEFNTHISDNRDSALTNTRGRSPLGSAGVAFDQGRAAAMQGLSSASCPYNDQIEPDRLAAWQSGYRSYDLNIGT